MTRLAYGEADAAAHRRFGEMLAEASLRVAGDAVGNLSGVWEPEAARAGAIMIGSHLDTVPSGGRYDGAAGLVTGLDVVRRLRERGYRPHHPVEIISFRNEEGTWRPGFTGSRALAGRLHPGELEAHPSAAGVTQAEAMRVLGLRPEAAATAARPPGSIAAYLEAHIEQGPVLEARGAPVGIVAALAPVLEEALVRLDRQDGAIRAEGRPNPPN